MKMEIKEALNELHKLGVEQIVVEYSGSGDSGDIDNSDYISKTNGSIDVPNDINDIVIDYIHSKILDTFSDWYNNEGGGGTLLIEVPSGKWNSDHYVNIITTEEESYSGDIK
jgi:hypothetical protein